MTTTTEARHSTNFIEEIIDQDRTAGRHGGHVVTRFPPEPNGYLHIGHAKSICLNFGLAARYGGVCHLRFDDTNPLTEDVEYAESIMRDVRWLGFEWGEKLFHASDYFEKLYDYAVELIQLGKAYVCSLSPQETSEYRGSFTEPGRDSPYRGRTVEENLDLFRRMRAGEFPDSAHTLRAKIDMASPNPNLRDPAIYRIRKTSHHRTGDAWCIYPLYDYTHCLSDAIEGITHSICTLEFENHRPLYDWVLDTLKTPRHPQQIEFARLNLTYTVMSKRKLLQLVEEKHVSGWDDPRMMTVSGLRRRGFTPASIRAFCETIGVSKNESWIDMGTLEQAIREDLNENAPRAMAVLRPLKVVIENYPEGEVEELVVANHPQKPEMGSRKVPFAREIFIEQDDFQETPQKGFFRLSPGREVRLRSAYFIRCERAVKDAEGRVTELVCTYDPATRGGNAPDGRKVKSTLHWVPAAQSIEAEVRLYDRLFDREQPDRGKDTDWKACLNARSLEVLRDCRIEPMLAEAAPESRFQFERQGYFFADPLDSKPGAPVWNRTVTLKDSWVKAQEKA